MRSSTSRARLTRRASYWIERLELALVRGDLTSAAIAQARLRALGWMVAPRSLRAAWNGPGLDPDDVAQDLAAELNHEHADGGAVRS